MNDDNLKDQGARLSVDAEAMKKLILKLFSSTGPEIKLGEENLRPVEKEDMARFMQEVVDRSIKEQKRAYQEAYKEKPKEVLEHAQGIVKDLDYEKIDEDIREAVVPLRTIKFDTRRILELKPTEAGKMEFTIRRALYDQYEVLAFCKPPVDDLEACRRENLTALEKIVQNRMEELNKAPRKRKKDEEAIQDLLQDKRRMEVISTAPAYRILQSLLGRDDEELLRLAERTERISKGNISANYLEGTTSEQRVFTVKSDNRMGSKTEATYIISDIYKNTNRTASVKTYMYIMSKIGAELYDHTTGMLKGNTISFTTGDLVRLGIHKYEGTARSETLKALETLAQISIWAITKTKKGSASTSDTESITFYRPIRSFRMPNIKEKRFEVILEDDMNWAPMFLFLGKTPTWAYKLPVRAWDLMELIGYKARETCSREFTISFREIQKQLGTLGLDEVESRNRRRDCFKPIEDAVESIEEAQLEAEGKTEEGESPTIAMEIIEGKSRNLEALFNESYVKVKLSNEYLKLVEETSKKRNRKAGKTRKPVERKARPVPTLPEN